MSEGKVLSVEEQLRNKTKDFREVKRIIEREWIESDSSLSDHYNIEQWIRFDDVLSVLKQHRTPEHKELLSLLKECPPCWVDWHEWCCQKAVKKWFEDFEPKLSAFLNDCALREAELKKLIEDFPKFEFIHSNKDLRILQTRLKRFKKGLVALQNKKEGE